MKKFLLVFGLAVGVVALAATADADGRYAKVDWPGAQPDDLTCGFMNVVLGPYARGLYGLDGGDNDIAYAKLCFQPDAGNARQVAMAQELAPVSAFEESAAALPTSKTELWLGGKSRDGGDGFPCACLTDAGDCERFNGSAWVAASPGMNIDAGQWRGAGCYRTACGNAAAYSLYGLSEPACLP